MPGSTASLRKRAGRSWPDVRKRSPLLRKPGYSCSGSRLHKVEDPTRDPLRVAIVIGEASGDQLGAPLVEAVRRRRPDAQFFGLAGERMGALGVATLFPV